MAFRVCSLLFISCIFSFLLRFSYRNLMISLLTRVSIPWDVRKSERLSHQLLKGKVLFSSCHGNCSLSLQHTLGKKLFDTKMGPNLLTFDLLSPCFLFSIYDPVVTASNTECHVLVHIGGKPISVFFFFFV